MILTLKGKVTFTKPNTTIKFEHDFQKGMTVITGPNEKGKSLRLEFIRFAWFGSSALRANRDQYQTIQVESSAQFGADVYRVERTLSNAKLFKNNVQQAIGTTPVNAAIAKLFGYDLAVFDTANCCKQGEIQALTKMKAGERKRMVDKTIGLDAIDDLVKKATDQVTGIRKALEIMEKRIDHSLVEPTKPDRYKPYGEWEEVVDQLQDRKIARARLEQEIVSAYCEEPSAPKIKSTQTIDELEALVLACRRQQQVVERSVDLRSELGRIPTYKDKLEDLEKYVEDDVQGQWLRYKEYDNCRRMYPQPKFPEEYSGIIAKAVAQKAILDRIENIKDNSTMNCPVCKADFCLEQHRLTELEEQIDPNLSVDHWLAKREEITKAHKGMDRFDEAWRMHKEFLTMDVVEEPEQERIGDNIPNMIAAIKRRAEIVKLLDIEDKKWDEYELQTKGMELRVAESLLKTAKDEENDRIRFSRDTIAYGTYLNIKRINEAAITKIGDVDGDLAEAKRFRADSNAYDQRMSDYRTKLEVNARVQAEIDVMKTDLDTLLKVREGLNDIKPKVKSYLVPSLNRVASNLLHQMTNGVRNSIDINEEFDILVDGQVVETLSGSAEAATNLAIRIGLGTVLTKKVFSVFMADEIDAAMSEERAAYTAECLRNLTKVFDQVFLVTHKDVQGDHRIQL